MLAMSHGLVIKFSPCEIILATEDAMFFTVMIALIPSRWFSHYSSLTQSIFYNNFLYVFPKELISFHKG